MVKTTWSSSWVGSKSPKKQRRYVYDAPRHVKSTLLTASVAEELQKKHKVGSARVRKGDTVKILRGQFKKMTGKIEHIDLVRQKVHVAGAQMARKDGSKVYYPIHASNLQIIEFDLTKTRPFAAAKAPAKEAKVAAKEDKKEQKPKSQAKEKKQ